MSGDVKFRWAGSIYAGRIIGEGTEGRTRIEALQHGPRFSVGSHLDLESSEIILPIDTSEPPTPNDPKAMQAAMDKEVEKLPTVKEIIADPNFTPPLSASSNPAAVSPTERTMADVTIDSPLAEKMKAVAIGSADVIAQMTAKADAFLAKKSDVEKRMVTVFAKHEQVLADAHAGLDTVENALRLLSNGGPA